VVVELTDAEVQIIIETLKRDEETTTFVSKHNGTASWQDYRMKYNLPRARIRRKLGDNTP
jgi:hypothetical protein